jgi:large subunit ribosomal protein L32e
MVKRSNKEMESIKELLELRSQIKSRKPNFIRQDFHKQKKLGRKWRRPKGLHSKVRLKLKGRAKKVSKGYRSPKKVRHIHKSGLQQCIIRTMRDIEKLDAKKNCLVISSSLGDKKKIVILKKAKDLGFNISNVNNPDDYIKKVEDKIRLRKEKEKDKVKKDVKTKKKDEKLADKVNEEEKKEIEKKEKDKILTKKV